MKALTMAGVLAVAAVAALPPPARAASWGVTVVVGHDDHTGRASRGDWRGTGPAFRYGYDRGWRDGSEEGHRDGRKRRDPRYWREDDFRDADSGYKRRMGRRVDYVKGYREGYASGYRRAYAAARPGWRDRDRDRYDARHRYDDRGRRKGDWR